MFYERSFLRYRNDAISLFVLLLINIAFKITNVPFIGIAS